MRLVETVAAFFGRVELVLAGAEGALRDGTDALARGDAMRARKEAKVILSRVPHSPIGLALLADACEAAGLDAELALTLEELAGIVASRADVWVRLGRARERVGSPGVETRDAFLRALGVADPGSEPRREALLWLADFDLATGDGGRAELWLERLVDRRGTDVALRRAEARLAQGDVAGAKEALASVPDDPTDGRAALVRGRVLTAEDDLAAMPLLLRALVLDTRGASEALARAVSTLATDDATRARVRTVVAARGEEETAAWRAAFARAEGRRDEARAALVAAVRAGDAAAARPLLDAALDDRDHAALQVALGALGTTGRDAGLVRDARKLPSPARLRDVGEAAAILDTLASVSAPKVAQWAEELRRETFEHLVPPAGTPSDWTRILTRLDGHARALHALDATARVEGLAVERSRPVRLAIVGEFNAGKSTFINAVMGADVAPTGVLPTTATLHHLRYAPDPFARIQYAVSPDPGRDVRERIVPSSELRAALATGAENVARVEILMPIPSLTRVEILDTPGFNAPDVRHTEAARAAFDEADALIWLLDAAQALKQSERRILEEAKRQKLPVQILVNKADRLSPADLERVMSTVAEALAETGITSWSPPRSLSARLALKGKLGDEAALAASRWADVQELLDVEIVGRSAELKERGLRRRARRVVSLLLDLARAKAETERGEADALRARTQALSLRGAALDRENESAAQVLAGALGPAAEEWRRDLEAIVTGRDAAATKADPVLARYREGRAVTRLAEPLARVLASIAEGGGSGPVPLAEPADLLPLARAIVRTFAATGGGPASLAPLARSAVAALVDHLVELAAAPLPAFTAEGRVAELETLARALDRLSETPLA